MKSGNRTINNIIASGLTLTWDVLKFNKAGDNSISEKRLTLTWDVLKSNRKLWPLWGYYKININMRCIEIISERMKHGNFSQININMRCIEMLCLKE